jgi:hypothetical protein
MINPDFDPLQDLEELKKFCVAADMHIENLNKNQQVFIQQINELRKDVLDLVRVNKELMERLNETDR